MNSPGTAYVRERKLTGIPCCPLKDRLVLIDKDLSAAILFQVKDLSRAAHTPNSSTWEEVGTSGVQRHPWRLRYCSLKKQKTKTLAM